MLTIYCFLIHNGKTLKINWRREAKTQSQKKTTEGKRNRERGGEGVMFHASTAVTVSVRLSGSK